MRNEQAKYIIALLILLAPIPVAGQKGNIPGKLISLVQTVLDRNPALKGMQAKLKGSQSGLNEVRSLRIPQLSVQSSATRGDNPVYVFGSLLEQRKFGPQNFAVDSLNNPDYLTNYKNALVFGVPVFTGLELTSQERMARIGADMAQVQIEQTNQALRYQTTEGYLQVMLTQQILTALKERIASSADEIESARKLNARGLVLGSDFFAAQAIFSALRTREIQLEKNLESALARLSVMTGRPADQLEIVGVLTETPYTIDPEETLFKVGVQNRSELKIARDQTTLAKTVAKQSERGFWPRINAFASVETNTEDFSSNPSNRMIGVRSDFPIGDPAYFARRAKMDAAAEEAARFRENAEDQVRIDVLEALKRYQGAAESLTLSKETAERARHALELFRPLYREGRQSIIEVLRAEEGLFQAESMHLKNLYDLHSGFAQLAWATGAMDEAKVLDIQNHLEVRP